MSLYLTYHPWVPGTMSRDRVLAMLSEAYQAWQSKGLVYRTYIGTEDAAEGFSLIEAPDKATLIRVLEESRIPYLNVSEAWQVFSDELGMSLAADGVESRAA